MTMPTPAAARPPSRPVALLLLLVFLAVLVRTAWISDDALISLRTVMNVTTGYGLTFNVGERVQTFTHPLWLLLLTAVYGIVRNVYYATFLLPLAVSAWVFWLAVTRAGSVLQAWLAAAILLSSRAFVDYSTSGLENPLANLLVAAFVGVFVSERMFRGARLTILWALASLLYLTRPDVILLVAPALLLAGWEARQRRDVLRAAALGLLPAIAWTAFAITYYGFPFPNTAYAKLGMGVSRSQIWTQGLLYIVDSLDRDPATLVVIAAALAVGAASRVAFVRACAAGIALYLVYIVSIGGDFMSGRFFAVPLMLAVLVLSRLVTAAREAWLTAIGAVVVLGVASAKMPILADSRFLDNGVKHAGIVDERTYYFKAHSLAFASMSSFAQPDWDARRPAGPQRVQNTCGLMGEAGLALGPHWYLLDECALADPLLARLPATFREEWRPGHFGRWVPYGYRETLEQGTMVIPIPELREYYGQLSLITRSADLWSGDRWRAIWKMNTGQLNGLIDADYYRFGGLLKALDEVADVKADETPLDAPLNTSFARPITIRVPARAGRRFMDVSVDGSRKYGFVFVKGNEAVGRVVVDPVPEHRRKPGLVSYTLDVPSRAVRLGFSAVLILPGAIDQTFVLGHLILEGNPKTDKELYRRVAVRDGAATP